MKKGKKKAISSDLQDKLTRLEEQFSEQGIHLHYDLLEAAGLKLKDGICKINGEYHIFIDRRKSAADKINILREFLNNPLPEDIPQNHDEGPQPKDAK